MNLYASKGAINARLMPLVDRLLAAGISPDAITLPCSGLRLCSPRLPNPLPCWLCRCW